MGRAGRSRRMRAARPFRVSVRLGVERAALAHLSAAAARAQVELAQPVVGRADHHHVVQDRHAEQRPVGHVQYAPCLCGDRRRVSEAGDQRDLGRSMPEELDI
eukprot:6179519-Pleurochrysis_carterae.AAC.2